jgi:hypothetical protein
MVLGLVGSVYSPKASAVRLTSSVTQLKGPQGVNGQVLYGPISPVCGGEIACYMPVQTSVTVMNSRGKTVATVATDENGNFSVKLKPGLYTLKNGDLLSLLHFSQQVTVVSGQYSQVTINIDSGIR